MESSSSTREATAAAISRVKLQNPFVLRVGQVMTGFGVGCGLGIGVGMPIPMGNSLSTFQYLCPDSDVSSSFCRTVAFGRVECFWFVSPRTLMILPTSFELPISKSRAQAEGVGFMNRCHCARQR